MKNLKKLILILILLMTTVNVAFAAKIPDNLKTLVRKDYPKADFRFDGVLILPDGTIYLPLFPSLIKKPDVLQLKATNPEHKTLADKPDIIIFNNDFVLLKVLVDNKGNKTVTNMVNPPLEVKTGLLPQDMLVPSGLVIPDNLKGIIGNLQITTAADSGLRVKAEHVFQNKIVISKANKNLVSSVPQLQNKLLYIATCYSKNIQVVSGERSVPDYALAQKSVPIDIEVVGNDKLMLVTTFSKTFVDVISLADERVIKQIDLTTQAEEIVVDKVANKAYVSSSADSSIYIIDIATMTLNQKIKVKGACEKLYLTQDGNKLFYFDRNTNDIWAIELNNGFVIKNIGKFPNVSKIAFVQNKIYVTSRTKNRLAIIDYVTLGQLNEIEVEQKPIDMLSYKDKLFILSAQNNAVQVLDTTLDEISATVYLNTDGFSTKICQVGNTNIALITDTKAAKYSVLDLDKNIVIKTNALEVPVSVIVVANKIKKIGK